MPTAEERKALRDSIPVDGIVDPELQAKAGIPPTETPAIVEEEPEPEVKEEPVAAVEEPEEGAAAEEKKVRAITQETLDRRIAKEVAKTKAQQERADALERRLAALDKKEGNQELTDAERREQIRLEAEKIANDKIFATACNNLAEAADKELKGFGTRYETFKEDVGELPQSAVESILNLDNGHSVLNHLVGNPDEAEKILKMNPTRQTIELAKISEKLSAAKIKRVSRAPAPIDPIGGRAAKATALPTDGDTDEDWFAKRQATKRDRVYR